MADTKISLEDILDEYKTDPNDGSTSHVGRADAQRIINSTLPEAEKKPSVVPKAVSHEKNELFDDYDEKTIPANEIQPTELSRKTAAVANSDGISDIRPNRPDGEFDAENVPDITVGTPKIRRMADSTRAKEAEKNRRKKFWQKKEKQKPTYSKESPSGEYMYTPPEFKKKKRSRDEIINEAESPEMRKYVTDIVPSPAFSGASSQVHTMKIDLGETKKLDMENSDPVKGKRTVRMVDFNHYGDVQDVGRDIRELKNIIKTRVAVLSMTAFLSVYITVCSRLDLPIADFLSIKSIYTYLIIHLLLGILAIMYSLPVITKGFKNLIKFKADSDSMTAVTAAACFISLLTAFLKPDLAKTEFIHIYMPVGILALLFNAMGKNLILKRAYRNFKFASGNFDRHAVVYVRDEERAERLTHGTLGDFPILASMRPTDYLTDFLKYTYSADITDSYCRKAVPVCLIGSAALAVFFTFFRMGTLFSAESAAFGSSIFSMLICAASCIGLPFAANVPLEKVSKQTLKNDGILLGYQSVDDLYDTNSVLATADDLFPVGTVRLGGIKVFSNTKLDEAFLYAASLTHHGGSLMQQLFSDIIEGKEELLYNVENFSYEDEMGICGWINNRRILLGNRELMTSHNIEGLPTKTREAEYSKGQEPIYLSISGNLAAMFVVDLVSDRATKKAIEKLVKKKICIIVKATDPFITQEKIAEIYKMPKNMVKVLPKKLHEDFDAETRKAVHISASMACSGKFSSMANLILGIKKIHSSAITALIFQTASILLGFGLSMLLILSKAFESNYIYMSSTAMIVYNLICTGLTLFSAKSKKN